jgi:hypothetical protein
VYIASAGIDLAKTTCHLVALNDRGKIVIQTLLETPARHRPARPVGLNITGFNSCPLVAVQSRYDRGAHPTMRRIPGSSNLLPCSATARTFASETVNLSFTAFGFEFSQLQQVLHLGANRARQHALGGCPVLERRVLRRWVRSGTG